MAYKPQQKVACSICEKQAVARQLCRSHYSQAHARGELKMHRLLGPEDVFDGRYKVMPSGCWEWIGSRNSAGYGVIQMPGTNLHMRAHRYSYERTKGKIPTGKVIMHACDNRPCVNPDHLSAGTRLQNGRDAGTRSRLPFGAKHWNTRLTDTQVAEIRRLAGTMSQIAIARSFGVHQSHISTIISGKRRTKA